jgi:hypothetical protein
VGFTGAVDDGTASMMMIDFLPSLVEAFGGYKEGRISSTRSSADRAALKGRERLGF